MKTKIVDEFCYEEWEFDTPKELFITAKIAATPKTPSNFFDNVIL